MHIVLSLNLVAVWLWKTTHVANVRMTGCNFTLYIVYLSVWSPCVLDICRLNPSCQHTPLRGNISPLSTELRGVSERSLQNAVSKSLLRTGEGGGREGGRGRESFRVVEPIDKDTRKLHCTGAQKSRLSNFYWLKTNLPVSPLRLRWAIEFKRAVSLSLPRRCPTW